tara:strand:- start:212 stop:691 length:480 start_codon:yes stop_codon:yes gene_type:complete
MIKITKEQLAKIIAEEVVDYLNERCQKGYKTHPTRKTKKMYGKTYRNCIKAEQQELSEEEALEEKKKRKKKRKLTKKASSEGSLRDWFRRRGGGKGKGGWVDCNAPRYKKGKKVGYKSCGRQEGEKRSKYPACRPTAAACKDRGKGKKWGKKAARSKKK